MIVTSPLHSFQHKILPYTLTRGHHSNTGRLVVDSSGVSYLCFSTTVRTSRIKAMGSVMSSGTHFLLVGRAWRYMTIALRPCSSYCVRWMCSSGTSSPPSLSSSSCCNRKILVLLTSLSTICWCQLSLIIIAKLSIKLCLNNILKTKNTSSALIFRALSIYIKKEKKNDFYCITDFFFWYLPL